MRFLIVKNAYLNEIHIPCTFYIEMELYNICTFFEKTTVVWAIQDVFLLPHIP